MQNKITALFQYTNDSLLVAAEHDPWLVLLSVLIAIFASFMGFQVASQAAYNTSARKHLSLLVGSIALGGGVWSMHFIGMLALDLCTDISYQLEITAVSVLPAIAASWVALNLITRKKIKWPQLVLGGVLVGAGIGTMHYVGMAAMEMAPLLRYDLLMFCISILVAVSLAILSLWISFGLDKNKALVFSKNSKIIISSCVMGAAISGMHYTGMAAARFVLPPGIELSQQSNEISLILAMIVTVITVVIIGLVLAANLIFRYKDKSTAAIHNERRLIATMNTAIDGIITIDAKGIIISVNNAVSKLLGWQPEELLGQNVKMIVPMPYQTDHDQYLDNYLKTRQAKIIGSGREVDAMTKSKETIPVRLSIGHVELDNQHMFVAFISDLRARKEMENKLRDNEAKIRALVTNIPGIAYRCLDVPGWPNLFINDEVEKIIGYPAEDFLYPDPKRSIADFVHPEDMEGIGATDLRHPDGYKLEFRIIDRYNAVKWMLGYGRALKIENSDDYYLDGFIMDITDRKKMESELVAAKDKAEKAAETRAAFLANMSHEIRTPMNAIIGFSDILLDDELVNHQRKQLNTINQAAKSLLHILNDVLDSAKLDKGKLQLEYRDFSLVEEVDAVVSTLWLQAQNKGLEIALNVDKAAQCYYNGAPDRIRQVLTNLIGNSVKFTEQGKISITIKENTPGLLTFSISDTGIGMTPEQLETIFDAFSQADESMSRRFGGTGLGTTISKQLVELMSGTITASSEQGLGSTFEFTIPLQQVNASSELQTKEESAKLPHLHILVVDDIEQNIELLTLLLKRNSHTVSVARDGEQALLKMASEQLDIVLMDIQMPVMDGLTASRKRREFELANGLPRLPIVALTASVLPQDRQSSADAGMDGFANKPIDTRQLMGEISGALSAKSFQPAMTVVTPNEQLKIDTEKGINLWGSKTSLFVEINRFLSQSENDISLLKVLIVKNDWLAIEEIAHKYKGVTGNLALNRLMNIFGELEQASRKKQEQDALFVLTKITAEIVSISQCSNKMSDGTDKDGVNQSSGEHISDPQLVEILLQLQHHVENNEFDESLLDTLQAIASSHNKEVNTIITACNDFDFELASKYINTLVDSLKPDS
ncbi:MAG: MHYT domain-containing protein [Thalassotalea sp.]